MGMARTSWNPGNHTTQLRERKNPWEHSSPMEVGGKLGALEWGRLRMTLPQRRIAAMVDLTTDLLTQLLELEQLLEQVRKAQSSRRRRRRTRVEGLRRIIASKDIAGSGP